MNDMNRELVGSYVQSSKSNNSELGTCQPLWGTVALSFSASETGIGSHGRGGNPDWEVNGMQQSEEGTFNLG